MPKISIQKIADQCADRIEARTSELKVTPDQYSKILRGEIVSSLDSLFDNAMEAAVPEVLRQVRKAIEGTGNFSNEDAQWVVRMGRRGCQWTAREGRT